MTIRSLAEVGARLEETVSTLLGDDADSVEPYMCYEMIAIEILDSEYADFPDGVLASFLKEYLLQKRLELGVDESDLI